MANEVQALTQRYNTVRDWFAKDEVRSQLKSLVPAHVNPDKLLRHALTTLSDNPDLLSCSQKSLIRCIMGAMQLGLSFEKFLGQAYLVPFNNNKTKQKEVQLIVGYRGYITLARNSGEVAHVSAHAVYDKDIFDVKYGTDEKLEHIPAEGDRGVFKGAYVVFKYKDGDVSFDYMGKEKIDSIRARSKAGDFGPWKTDYDEMAVKTVIRRHIKLVPLSVEMARAAALEERNLIGEVQDDLLPQVEAPDDGVDTTSVTELTDVVTAFVKKTEESLKAIGVEPTKEIFDKMDAFTKLVAQSNNATTQVVHTEALKKWGQFWGSFVKYAKLPEKKAERKKAEPKASEPPPPPSVPSPDVQAELGQEPSAMVPCPDMDGRDVPAEACKDCSQRQGCPTWGA